MDLIGRIFMGVYLFQKLKMSAFIFESRFDVGISILYSPVEIPHKNAKIKPMNGQI